MAASHPDQSGIKWVEPVNQEAMRLMEKAQPAANMPSIEAQAHVEWALSQLKNDAWHERLVAQRVEALKASHARLRTLVGAKPLEIFAHTPPDILGLCVLVPSGGGI